MAKNLESYKLGVVIDAKAADALKALAGVDAQTNLLAKDFKGLEATSAKSAKGVGVNWKSAISAKLFSPFTSSGKQAFAQIERDGQQSAGKLKKLFASIKVTGGGASAGGGGIGSSLLGGAAMGLASGGIGILASGVTAVAGAFKDAAVRGLEYNSMLENAAISMTTLTGSAAKAQQHLKDLEAFGSKTPFELPGLIETSQRLQAFGFDAQQVIPMLEGVGNALSAMGNNSPEYISRATLALGQMAGKAKVSAEEMGQLIDAGVPADWDLLAKAIGKTVAQTQALATAGQLKGKEAALAITQQSNIRYAGQMAAIANTRSGLLSNVSDMQAAAEGKATRNLAEAEKDAYRLALANGKLFDQLAAQLDQATGAGINFAKGIAKGVMDGAPALIEAGKAAVDTTYQAVKAAAGINSPAVAFVPLGAAIDEGLAKGVREGGQLSAEVKKLIDEVLTAGTAEIRRRAAAELAKIPEVQAMLATLGKSEGAGYRTKVGGGVSTSAQTNQKDRRIIKLSGSLSSSADGRYQFLNKTWDNVAARLGLGDFSPQSQDLGAISLMASRGMLQPLLQGNVTGAFTKGNREWASLPGSPYGQPTNSAKKLLNFFNSVIGKTGGGASVPAPSASPRLSNAEAFALYNPGSANPYSTPSTTKPVAVTATTSAPLPVTITDTTPVNVNVAELSGARVPEATALPGLGIDQSKALAAKESLFALERSAPAETAAAGANLGAKQIIKGGGSTSLFRGMGAPIGEGDNALPDNATKIQAATLGMKGAFVEVKKIGEQALGTLASGVGNLIEAWVMGGDSMPQAGRKITAQILASAAAESAVLAVIETAKGFAALASYDPVSATNHFTAAGIFAGVAGGAAIAGRAVASGIRKDGQQSGFGSNGENRDVTSEGYAGNNFAANNGQRNVTKIGYSADYQTYAGGGNKTEKLLESINSKLNPVNGQQMVLATLKNNVREVARATVAAVNGDYSLGNRLGQRVA